MMGRECGRGGRGRRHGWLVSGGARADVVTLLLCCADEPTRHAAGACKQRDGAPSSGERRCYRRTVAALCVLGRGLRAGLR